MQAPTCAGAGPKELWRPKLHEDEAAASRNRAVQAQMAADRLQDGHRDNLRAINLIRMKAAREKDPGL